MQIFCFQPCIIFLSTAPVHWPTWPDSPNRSRECSNVTTQLTLTFTGAFCTKRCELYAKGPEWSVFISFSNKSLWWCIFMGSTEFSKKRPYWPILSISWNLCIRPSVCSILSYCLNVFFTPLLEIGCLKFVWGILSKLHWVGPSDNRPSTN